MYVVRNKKTKALIQMANSTKGIDLKAEEVYRGFDPKTMEFGRYHEQHLPSEFEIVDGVVKSLDEEPVVDLTTLKIQKLAAASRQSFEERMKLIPDHEVLNAALGIYPDKRIKQIQETVKAFREEYKRFEAALGKARSRKDIEALEPKFPTKLQG